MSLWSPITEQRPVLHYLGIVVVVPLALGIIAWSPEFALISLLVTIGVTPTMLGLYFSVVPRFGVPRGRLGGLVVHVVAILVGSAVGSLPASLFWAAIRDHPVGQVYGSVLRIALVVTSLVTLAVVALDRAARRPSAAAPAAPEVPRLTARQNGTLVVLDPREVSRLYAVDKYVAAQVDGREVLLDESLTALEERLGAVGFVRTHRGELVNRHHIRSFDRQTLVLLDGQRARVSRRAAARVRRLIAGR